MKKDYRELWLRYPDGSASGCVISLVEAVFLSQIPRNDSVKIPRLVGIGHRTLKGENILKSTSDATVTADLSNNLVAMIGLHERKFRPINAVDIVPCGDINQRFIPSRFYEPESFVLKKPHAYLQGLTHALGYLGDSHGLGFWPTDTQANAPFLLNAKGQITIVDTGLNKTIYLSPAFNIIRDIYRNTLTFLQKTQQISFGEFRPLHETLDKQFVLDNNLIKYKPSLADFATWLKDAKLFDYFERFPPQKWSNADDLKMSLDIYPRLSDEPIRKEDIVKVQNGITDLANSTP